MNIGKKLLSLLTVFCLTLSLVPTVALAEEPSTNGVATEVKFAKKSSSYGSNYITLDASTPYLASNGSAASDHQPSDGYAYFHDGILTLNGFTHTKGISATGNLKIELKGDSKIGTESYNYSGDTPNNDIIIEKEDSIHANLTIIGDGSLTLKKAVNSTLFVNGDLTIKEGAKVTAEGGSSGQAIDAKGNIILDGANTELTATQGYRWAIQAGNGSGTITIQNSAKMKVTPAAAEINIKDKKLIVDGTPTAFEANREFASTGKPTFTVTLPTGTGYTVSGKTSVNYDESYTFTVTIDRQYLVGSNFSVKVNDVEKTANSGTSYTYTIPNVRENLIITVEGVKENVLATPDGKEISFAAKSEDGGQLTVPDSSSYEYSIDGGNNWINADSTTKDITGVTENNDVKVRLKATDTAKASEPYTIDVTKATAPSGLTGQAPTTKDGNDGKITGLTDVTKIEYKTATSEWITPSYSGREITGLSAATYYVRMKAAGTVLASTNATVNVDEYVAKYQVWVKDIQVTDANKDDILGDNSKSVTYTPANGDTPAILTLSNAHITNNQTPPSGGMYYIAPNGITAKEDLKINVIGTNTIESEHGNPINATKNLTISDSNTANNSLELKSKDNMTVLSLDYAGPYNLIISGSVNVKAIVETNVIAATSVSANKMIIQDNAKVTVINHGKNMTIYCRDALAVKDSATLIAQSENNNHAVTVENGFTYPGHIIEASEKFDGSEFDTTYNPAKLNPGVNKDGYKYVKVRPTTAPVITGVELNKNSLSMKTGATEDLTPVFTPTEPSEKTVTWASSNEAVATVTKGKVTAVGVGTATITVLTKDGGYTDTCTVTVSNPSSSSGSHTTYYPVNTPEKSEGGSVVVSQKSASKGSAVTVTVTPESGYQVSSVQAVDKDGKKLTLTDKGDGKYTFVMPASKVEVSASFAQVQKPEEASPYRDVSKDSYYYDAVQWASDKGITNGVADGVFAPDWVCTRGQIVTFLWRSVGSPAPKTAEMPFADVAEDAYYAQAVLWAVENGITKGTSETTFSPDQTCTRAHAVAFLYRLAGSPAVTGSSFQDVAADAYYNAAVAWAVQQGITNGTSETTFSPDETCTRAQIVTFLYRMDQAK